MRRFFVFIALMALSFLVSGIETINFKEVKIQGVWGIQCRKYCSAANGQLCGNVTQSCCQYLGKMHYERVNRKLSYLILNIHQRMFMIEFDILETLHFTTQIIIFICFFFVSKMIYSICDCYIVIIVKLNQNDLMQNQSKDTEETQSIFNNPLKLY
ncbi:hypothetical protein pb186bvf_006498 [Paramecium bursaria]